MEHDDGSGDVVQTKSVGSNPSANATMLGKVMFLGREIKSKCIHGCMVVDSANLDELSFVFGSGRSHLRRM
jgi:hypothetical protein